jgi:hypothetical protein
MKNSQAEPWITKYNIKEANIKNKVNLLELFLRTVTGIPL